MCRDAYLSGNQVRSCFFLIFQDESQYPCSQMASHLVPFGTTILLLVAIICEIAYVML